MGKAAMLYFLLFIIFTAGCSKTDVSKNITEQQGILAKIQNMQGYVRVIGPEEYELYKEMVLQEEGNLSGSRLEEETREYAERINALFYLGNRLDLYEAYSLEVLKLRMEEENEKRRIKLEKNEPVYGLQQFEIRSFLQYEMTNLERDIKDHILSQITREELGDKPKQFYQDHEEEFRLLKSVTYQLTMEEETRTITADRMNLRSMRNADMALVDFINEAKVGDVYEEPRVDGEGVFRTVKIVDLEYEPMGYEANRENAIIAYVETVLFEELLEMVADNNPPEYAE